MKKKSLLRTIIVLVILAVGGWVMYEFYLPKIIANVVVKTEKVQRLDSILESKLDKHIQEKEKEIETKLATLTPQERKTVKVVRTLSEDTLAVDFDLLIQAIENVNAQQVLQTLDELNEVEINSNSQVFDIAKKNIRVNEFDVELLRPVFMAHIKVRHIKRCLNYINGNDLTSNMSVKVAREIAKKMFIEKKEKIEKRLGIYIPS